MNCKHCHNEKMAVINTERTNNIKYTEYYCCWCGSTVIDEKYVKRKNVTQDYVDMFNRKIKLKSAKIHAEYNRGLTSELFKSYIRAGYIRFGNDEDGYRIYDDKNKLIVESDTWTECLFKLYKYHEEQIYNKENKLSKECVVC